MILGLCRYLVIRLFWEIRFSFAYLSNPILLQFHIYLSEELISSQMSSHEIITAMTGFTSDFFGALQNTFTDNSFSNSKADMSQTNGNRSQILKQLKEQSMEKIAFLLTKMIKSAVLDQIYDFGEKRRRRNNKTAQNIYRRYYKIQLNINMKNRSLLQNAFFRIVKFAEQYKMSDILSQFPKQQPEYPRTPKVIEQQIISNAEMQVVEQNQISMKKKKQVLLVSDSSNLQQQPSMKIAIPQPQPKIAAKTKQILDGIYTGRKVYQAFKNIQLYENYLNKKAYLIQLIIFISHENIRFAILKMLNYQKSIIMQQKEKDKDKERSNTAINQTKQRYQKQTQYGSQRQIDQQGRISRKNNVSSETYGLQSKIKFKKTSKYISSEKVIRQPVPNESEVSQNSQGSFISQSSQNSHLSKEIKSSRSNSGLKFNKCFKKKPKTPQSKQSPGAIFRPKSKSKPKLNMKTDINLKQPSTIKEVPSNLVVKAARPQKIKLNSKAAKIQINLNDDFFKVNSRWKQFNKSQNTYHLAPQQLKLEIPDCQDPNFSALEQNPMEIHSPKSNSNSNSQVQFLSFSKRIHKIDSTKPLQFSNKKKSKSRSKISSGTGGSKNSIQKSDQQQIEQVNVQSLKSYYFPQQQNAGKALVTIPEKQPQSTKFIGGSKWPGTSKKRTTTDVNLRVVKSSQKFNPYLQQLKSKAEIVRKPADRVISLSKMVEKSLSGRSSSKISRQSSKKYEKHERQQKQIIISANEYKTIPRNLSPQSRLLSQHSRGKPATSISTTGVPKQWCFYNRNTDSGYLGSPIKSPRQNKQNMPFQNLGPNGFKY